MRNRVMLAAGTLAIVPTLLFAQQRPAQQPAQRPAQRPPAAQPAQRPAPAPARPMYAVAGTAERQGAWRLGLNATGFIARDAALFGYLYSRVAAPGKAPDRYLPGALGSVAYYLSDNVSLGVDGGAGFTSGLTLLQGMAGVRYSFNPAQSLSPYVGVSVGGSSYSGDGSATRASGIGGYVMAGIRKFVGDNLAVNLDARMGMENYSSESITAIVGSVGVGLQYYTGGKKILTTISVNPAVATLTTLRQTQQLSAVARDQRGRPMAGPVIQWRSSNPGVATVSTSGAVTATGDGSATITASSAAVSGTAAVTVSRTTVTVAAAPATATLNALGATQQLTATARDAGSNPIASAAFSWTSSDASVASVSSSGLVTAAGNGTARITAASGGRSTVTTVTVAQMTATVTVTPPTSALTAAGATAQLAAQAADANGRTVSGKTFTWTSDAAGVATVSATGLATAVANGVAHVTAGVDGRSGSGIVTVVIATRGAPPIELPAVAAAPMVLRNVTFRTVRGRPTLTPAATADLDKVAITMQGTPNSRWEIGGHTSNVGRAPALTQRSQREADAVKAYLVSKGAAAASITAVGFGSQHPIGSNRTAAGRRQNNRIEIKRLQ